MGKSKLYTQEEDRIITEYVEKQRKKYGNNALFLGGNLFWKRLGRRGLLPGRTWSGVRDRYNKYIRHKPQNAKNKGAIFAEEIDSGGSESGDDSCNEKSDDFDGDDEMTERDDVGEDGNEVGDHDHDQVSNDYPDSNEAGNHDQVSNDYPDGNKAGDHDHDQVSNDYPDSNEAGNHDQVSNDYPDGNEAGDHDHDQVSSDYPDSNEAVAGSDPGQGNDTDVHNCDSDELSQSFDQKLLNQAEEPTSNEEEMVPHDVGQVLYNIYAIKCKTKATIFQSFHALQQACGSVDRAVAFLEDEHSINIWTSQEDEILKGNNEKEIEEIVNRHGVEAVLLRINYHS